MFLLMKTLISLLRSLLLEILMLEKHHYYKDIVINNLMVKLNQLLVWKQKFQSKHFLIRILK